MLAGMIFQQDPFFKGKDNQDQLVKIVKVLGYPKFKKYAKKYDLDIDPHIKDKISGYKGKAWDEFINEKNQHLVNEDALNFLDKLL